MDNARSVCRGKRAGNLSSDIERFAKLQVFAVHSSAQRLAVDELSRYEMHRIGLVNFVDGDDVGMIQSGCSLRFLDEALHAILMSSNIRGQNLQRNFAIEFCILRQIHLAHPTLANL